VRLLAEGRLHLRREHIGVTVPLPDGRPYTVFRESCCDTEGEGRLVTLVVWFHLRGIPARSRYRRLLFERLCLVNTFLFAGFPGYRVKLWMVDPETADFAGMYSWRSAEEAETYAEYITRVLAPLCVPSSVGYRLLPGTLDSYLTTVDAATPARERPGARRTANRRHSGRRR
jgi:hypothetical protein